MAKQVNLIAEVDTTSLSLNVTAAAGSAGTAIPISTASSAVTLIDVSLSGGVEYQVGGGAWVYLEKNEGNIVNADLSLTTIKLRLIADGSTSVSVDVVIDGLPVIRTHPNGPAISNGNSLSIATTDQIGGLKPDNATLFVDPTSGQARAPAPSALSTDLRKIGDIAAWGGKKRLMTTATGVAGVPNAGAATVYWPWVIRATDHIATPIDKFYMYYSTDHAGSTGNIWLATAPTPEGPWATYGAVYSDAAGGGETETPSVLWDRTNGRYVMMYQQINAVFNGGTRGVQSTLAAYSSDGVAWTKDMNFIIDVPYQGTQLGDGHTGYFLPFETRRGLFAYSLYGGTNSYGDVLWKSSGNLAGTGVNSNYVNGWTSDRKHLGYCLDLTNTTALGNRYMQWNHSFVVEAQGIEYHIGIISDLVSGATPKNAKLVASPISSDYRALLEEPRVIWAPDQAWESADLRSVTPFIDSGKLYIYYTIGKTEIGVISHAL